MVWPSVGGQVSDWRVPHGVWAMAMQHGQHVSSRSLWASFARLALACHKTVWKPIKLSLAIFQMANVLCSVLCTLCVQEVSATEAWENNTTPSFFLSTSYLWCLWICSQARRSAFVNIIKLNMLLVLFTAPFSVAVDVYVDFGWVGFAIEPLDWWTDGPMDHRSTTVRAQITKARPVPIKWHLQALMQIPRPLKILIYEIK